MMKRSLLVFTLFVAASLSARDFNSGFPLSKTPCWVTEIYFSFGCPATTTHTEATKAAKTQPVATTTQKTVPAPIIFFETNKTDLSSQGRKELDGLAAWLKQNSNAKAYIEGYADHPGTINRNVTLSKERAKGVKSYLLKKGVTSNQINANEKGNQPTDERKAVITVQ